MTQPTLNDLKAQAFDCLVQVENWTKRLQQANQAIANYKAPESDSTEPKPE